MSEHADQVALFHWASLQESRYPALALMIAIPNGAKLPWRKNRQGVRYSPEANRLVAEGMRAGVPDIAIFYPNGKYCGLFIELKVGRNKQTADQKRWQKMLLEQGYLAVVCKGWLEAKQVILDYLGVGEDDKV